jgi:hypothetical protein
MEGHRRPISSGWFHLELKGGKRGGGWRGLRGCWVPGLINKKIINLDI